MSSALIEKSRTIFFLKKELNKSFRWLFPELYWDTDLPAKKDSGIAELSITVRKDLQLLGHLHIFKKSLLPNQSERFPVICSSTGGTPCAFFASGENPVSTENGETPTRRTESIQVLSRAKCSWLLPQATYYHLVREEKAFKSKAERLGYYVSLLVDGMNLGLQTQLVVHSCSLNKPSVEEYQEVQGTPLRIAVKSTSSI